MSYDLASGKKKLRVIYLHQYFNTPEMSGGTRSYEMARRMVLAGHEVHMVTSYRESHPDKGKWFTTTEAGIQVHWYPVRYSNYMSFAERGKAFLAFALAARKKTVELDGAIIFATSTPLTIALPAVPAARKKNIPLVFEVRDLWPELPIAIGALKNPFARFFAHQLERWAYRNSEAVVALSPGMKEGILRTGYPSERIAVIPNSSDNVEFAYNQEQALVFRSKRDWLGDRPLLVYTGTFGVINGVGYMVELAKALLAKGSDVRILLVGDGAERSKIVDAASQAGVLNVNLYVEEKLPKREIPALLSAATMASVLFIDLPEMRPNSANKFFDALASGTPVMLNYGGWMHEIVKTCQCGLTTWEMPISEVAEILDSRIHDAKWLSEAGNAARNLAEQCFARDALASQLMEVLHAAKEGEATLSEKIAPGHYA